VNRTPGTENDGGNGMVGFVEDRSLSTKGLLKRSQKHGNIHLETRNVNLHII